MFISNSVYANLQNNIDIESVKSYMKSLKSITANFIQIDRRGESQTGKFYLSRPGKMRWEYQSPRELTIVLNNEKIYYYDKELDQVSHYIGSYGMMNAFIEDDIFASNNVVIERFSSDESMTNVTFKGVEDASRFTLVFNSNPLKILGCILEEASGNKVNLKFTSLTDHFNLDPSLFQLKQSLSPQR
jgi:outer membrane lipoprotein-sorting protein